VRPGAAAFNAKDGNKCTIGFLLRGGDGARYAILGHPCAPGSRDNRATIGPIDHEVIWPNGKGPQVLDSSGKVVGRLVYDINRLKYPKELDVALMRLESRVAYSPKVCQYGGPSGIDSQISNDPTTANSYGQGDQFYLGDGPHAHQDPIPFGLNDPVRIHAAISSEQPNAGGPVVVGDGSPALGVMSQWNETPSTDPKEGSGVTVFRLGPLIKVLQDTLHIKLTLIKAGER